jgi:hypothetical protein
MPNQLHPAFRAHARGQPERPDPWKKKKVNVTVLELLAELCGAHSIRSRHLYVSDGGHYDNLGLIELLRRKCGTIWCIDASGDKPGRATALAESILTAAGELGAQVDIDLRKFQPCKRTKHSGPVLSNTHVIGDIEYADGSTGKIVVIKTGLLEDSPEELFEHRARDRAFPHHSTLNQVYRAERFDAYRDLGWTSALRALNDKKAPPEPPAPPPMMVGPATPLLDRETPTAGRSPG